jgi:hypothetical protein
VDVARKRGPAGMPDAIALQQLLGLDAVVVAPLGERFLPMEWPGSGSQVGDQTACPVCGDPVPMGRFATHLRQQHMNSQEVTSHGPRSAWTVRRAPAAAPG